MFNSSNIFLSVFAEVWLLSSEINQTNNTEETVLSSKFFPFNF